MKVKADKLKVKITGGCWLLPKRINGYGDIRIGNKRIKAHRLSYRLFIGKIAQGLEIDHVCRRRNCINPKHLRAVSRYENIMSGQGLGARNARKKFCKRGHKLTKKDLVLCRTRKFRSCRICREIWRAERIRRKYEKKGRGNNGCDRTSEA